jgi:kinesin family protein 5
MDAQQRPAAVRVVARVRPLFSAPGARIARANATSIALASEHEAEVEFPFSQCFGEDASQEAVCKDMCERAVADVVRGFNATILAYGQTGSGKTHTMMGDLDSPRDQGVIPRLALGLFRALRPGSAVKATFVEIYREALRDLLDARSDQTLRIRELDGSRVAIAGAAEQVCVNAGELLEVLRRGSAMRSVGSTRMNQDSSRSHSVLTVTVESVDEDGSALQSKLVLVDLAGSEAVKKTLAAGERLEEVRELLANGTHPLCARVRRNPSTNPCPRWAM